MAIYIYTFVHEQNATQSQFFKWNLIGVYYDISRDLVVKFKFDPTTKRFMHKPEGV